MTRFLQKVAVLVHVLMGLMLMSNTASAETPFPTIHEPTDKSVKCIQPEDEMRRNHMKYILHERDETMHEGIRDEPESLANCINCHIEPDENGNVPRIDSTDHFCHGCHEYASVQIDCFQCHADRPQKYIKREASHSSSASTLIKHIQQTLAASELATANTGVNR